MVPKTISIVTPIFNSIRTLDSYMKAIISQGYPHEAIEIIFADGGSTDGTIELVNEFIEKYDIKISIINNPLRTGEAGKAVGVKHAVNEIICLLDSDNILPDNNWLSLMIKPFDEDLVIASDPIEFTYRREDNIINRYCALVGVNDPLCVFTGNYDRFCLITNKWTAMPRVEIDKGDYLSVQFEANNLPTIGANGFCIRRSMLMQGFEGDYLFDIDVLYELLTASPGLHIAKVKTGVIHLFCQDTKTFIRKQRRRIQDYLFFNKTIGRKYPWKQVSKWKIVMFVVFTVTIFPIIMQAVIGNYRKPDLLAWLYHVVACLVTVCIYGYGTIKSLFKNEAMSREGWKQ